MGPTSRYLGKEVPSETLIWQDPIPEANFSKIDNNDITNLKNEIKNSGLSNSQFVSTAWASASTFRGTDKRGGANGARINLLPQKKWEINQPEKLSKVLIKLEEIRTNFNNQLIDNKKVSLADVIVLAGYLGVENSSQEAGCKIDFKFTPWRNDAIQEQTDVESFSFLEPKSDAFRNHLDRNTSIQAEHLMLDQAHLLSLTAPEMTVLLAGMRMLNVNTRGTQYGVLTKTPGKLTNDYFINLLDMNTKWEPSSDSENLFEGIDRDSGDVKWTATRTDLIFGSNSQLRAIAEVYATKNSLEKFIKDFYKVWFKVMNLDKF